MEITVKTAEQLRITAEEFELIKLKLGRTPNFTELCCFSAMWSEHCSYKNSIKWLKTLPRDGKKMLVKAGEENAGLMDIGDGYGVVFKIESHNNPSAIEPFQGAATGIGGASFASADITAESAEELPAVQVGDPFQEKKLLEACLEVIKTGAVVGMQDMGAAGIICSTSEMSAKGESGMRIYLDKVPTRQKNMKAWELLLSESQERMLLVAEKGREDEVIKIFEKWDLPCSVIGGVTNDGMLRFYMHGESEAEIPAYELVLGG